jgi:hypothetical protein
MATSLGRNLLPVVSKIKFGRNVPTNLEECKYIYPIASMYVP